MTTNHKERRTSVKLRISTLDKLKEEGVMGESYDDVINRLIFKKRTGGEPDDETEAKLKRLL